MIGRSVAQRHTPRGKKGPHLCFLRAVRPMRRIWRHAAVAADEQRIVIRRQRLRIAILLQPGQQFVLLKRPLRVEFAFTQQRKERHQQRVLRLAVKQRADDAAENGKLIHATEFLEAKKLKVRKFGDVPAGALFEKVEQAARRDI